MTRTKKTLLWLSNIQRDLPKHAKLHAGLISTSMNTIQRMPRDWGRRRGQSGAQALLPPLHTRPVTIHYRERRLTATLSTFIRLLCIFMSPPQLDYSACMTLASRPDHIPVSLLSSFYWPASPFVLLSPYCSLLPFSSFPPTASSLPSSCSLLSLSPMQPDSRFTFPHLSPLLPPSSFYLLFHYSFLNSILSKRAYAFPRVSVPSPDKSPSWPKL